MSNDWCGSNLFIGQFCNKDSIGRFGDKNQDPIISLMIKKDMISSVLMERVQRGWGNRLKCAIGQDKIQGLNQG